MLRPIVLFQILAVAHAAKWPNPGPPPPADWVAQAIPPPSGNALCNPIYNQTSGTQAGLNASGYWNFYVQTPSGGGGVSSGMAVPQYFGGLVNPNTFYSPSGPGAAYDGQFAMSLPYNARLLSTIDLFRLSGQVCSFIPDYVEDTFSGTELNLYYWFPIGSYPYLYTNTQVSGNISTYNPVYAATGIYQPYNFGTSQQIYTPWYNPNVPYANVAPSQGQLPQYGTPAGVVTDHCPSAGAVGAAGPGVCTSLQPSNLGINVDLSQFGYKPTDASGKTTGLTMTLSHSNGLTFNPDGTNSLTAGCAYAPYPCTAGNKKDYAAQYCVGQTGSDLSTCESNCPNKQVWVCPAWSGAHLASTFCPQYGVLETEAAYNMPVAGGAYAFFGTVRTLPSPSSPKNATHALLLFSFAVHVRHKRHILPVIDGRHLDRRRQLERNRRARVQRYRQWSWTQSS